MSGFRGFPLALFSVFEGLAKDNSEAGWETTGRSGTRSMSVTR